MKGMTVIQAKRLLRVAQALREAKHPEDFTMARYVNECGTPACALGHYASRRDLQKLLELCKDKWRDFGIMYVGEPNDAGIYDPKVLEHFGITENGSTELFGGVGCGDAKTPTEAADYIDAFVKNQGFDMKVVK